MKRIFLALILLCTCGIVLSQSINKIKGSQVADTTLGWGKMTVGFRDTLLSVVSDSVGHVDSALYADTAAFPDSTYIINMGTHWADSVIPGEGTLYYMSAGNAFVIGTGDSLIRSGSMVLGYNSMSLNQEALIFGNSSVASGEKSLAIGRRCNALGDYSYSLGYLDSSVSTGSITMGRNNKSSGLASLAIGNYNIAYGAGSVSIGAYNYNMGIISSIVGGTGNYIDTVDSQAAIWGGLYDSVYAPYAVSIGEQGHKILAADSGIISLGYGSRMNGVYAHNKLWADTLGDTLTPVGLAYITQIGDSDHCNTVIYTDSIYGCSPVWIEAVNTDSIFLGSDTLSTVRNLGWDIGLQLGMLDTTDRMLPINPTTGIVDTAMTRMLGWYIASQMGMPDSTDRVVTLDSSGAFSDTTMTRIINEKVDSTTYNSGINSKADTSAIPDSSDIAGMGFGIGGDGGSWYSVHVVDTFYSATDTVGADTTSDTVCLSGGLWAWTGPSLPLRTNTGAWDTLTAKLDSASYGAYAVCDMLLPVFYRQTITCAFGAAVPPDSIDLQYDTVFVYRPAVVSSDCSRVDSLAIYSHKDGGIWYWSPVCVTSSSSWQIIGSDCYAQYDSVYAIIYNDTILIGSDSLKY